MLLLYLLESRLHSSFGKQKKPKKSPIFFNCRLRIDFILCESMQNYAYSVKILYCTCRKRVRNPALYRCVHFIKLAWYCQWYQSISKPCLWPLFQVPILELQGWIKNEANYICSFYCMTGYCIYRSLGDFNQCSSPKYFCTKIVGRI